eukprot:1918020-Pleurochrysis_carterae.AAC.1
MAVNRRIPAVATLAQSSRFHSVVDIGHPHMIRGRGRFCHACDRCWSGKAVFPSLKGFKQDAERPVCPQNVLAGHGVDRELKMEPTQNARTTRSMIAAAREKMANNLKPGMMLAILLNVGIGRDYELWLLGRLCGPARQALEGDVAEAAELSFKISLGQQVVELQKYKHFAPDGSREFAECSTHVIAPLSSLCLHDI